VDGINFLISELDTIPQEEVLASLRLFAKEVMPKFRQGAATSASPLGGVATGRRAGG